MSNLRNRSEEMVKEIGHQVLISPYFLEADKQTHHNVTTVARHSFRVACICFCICTFLYKVFNIRTNWKILIICALLHDLGIIGRYSKYMNNAQCCSQHPIDSLGVAEKILGPLGDIEIDIISHHMWPMTVIPPHTIEGFIITIADKYSAITDYLKCNRGPLPQISAVPEPQPTI